MSVANSQPSAVPAYPDNASIMRGGHRSPRGGWERNRQCVRCSETRDIEHFRGRSSICSNCLKR